MIKYMGERQNQCFDAVGWVAGRASACKKIWGNGGWLVGWGLTALLTQNRSYRACKFVGIFRSKL